MCYKKEILFLTALFLFFCLCSCGNATSEDVDEIIVVEHSSSSSEHDIKSSSSFNDSTEAIDTTLVKAVATMIKIYNPEEEILIGTNNKSARPSERPQMKVKLDYAYFMDVHEFTCGDYKKLDQKSIKLKTSCTNDSLPLTEVTYFDAVLIANAMSKANHLDTVYTYTKASFDEDNHCIDIEGLVTHLDVEGFRLPTEAEWIFAAQKDWKAENGGDNAAYELANPDWNKVVLIPVTVNADSRGSAISYNLDIYMHQVKLIGGDTPIKIKMIRSKF